MVVLVLFSLVAEETSFSLFSPIKKMRKMEREVGEEEEKERNLLLRAECENNKAEMKIITDRLDMSEKANVELGKELLDEKKDVDRMTKLWEETNKEREINLQKLMWNREESAVLVEKLELARAREDEIDLALSEAKGELEERKEKIEDLRNQLGKLEDKCEMIDLRKEVEKEEMAKELKELFSEKEKR